ncbi:Rho GTPase activating protein [Malassezia caprae]|uniref:Rho GTPase activating protein n=1 Tax=Malassezia caprae TaxID=1381934 RepID=A0AAF0E7G3_9BASI|nr:Rho GTPase activating protein [Malassezia caprae]
MAYPPPPLPRRRGGPADEQGDETALHEAATLYAASPHVHVDERERERRARRTQYGRRSLLFMGPASQISPTWLLSLVLVLGVLWVLWPRRGPPHVPGRAEVAAPLPSIPVCAPRMPAQKTFTLASRSKGCHLVQDEVEREVRDMLRGVQVGLLTLFLQHTSAALSLNENFDRDVRSDMDMAMDHIVPESLPWRHTDEGPDDSASHSKSSLIGPSLTIPITNGRMNLGTWQGVYLCEFRRMKHARRIVATVLP